MPGEKQRFDDRVFDLVARQEVLDASNAQPKSPFQGQQWEKEQVLVPDYQTAKAAFFERVFFTEGENRDINVGVHPGLVGIAVMSVVFVHPPSPLHSQQEADAKTGDVVPAV